jgi:hypothetical protein
MVAVLSLEVVIREEFLVAIDVRGRLGAAWKDCCSTKEA